MNVQSYYILSAAAALTTEKHSVTGMNIIFDLSGVFFEKHVAETQPKGATFALKPSNLSTILRLLEDCSKQGHRLFVISNWSQQWYEFMLAVPSISRIFDFFDDVILADSVGIKKPDPRIFDHLIEKHRLDPRRCIFIDDQKINLEAAQQAGICKGILCKNLDLAEVRQELQIHGAL